MRDKTYIAIDLKSFYASVECVKRGLDPLNTCLVVADKTRTEKTICLAVSPALKAYGVPGRPRLFEVVQKVKEVNEERLSKSKRFKGRSYFKDKLDNDDSLKLDYIVAPPRMAYYMEYSTQIFDIYLKYVSEEDVHVYSIDEVFIDATSYLKTYKMDGHTLAMTMIRDVLKQTGITATAGIGTNMYLAKVAMDVVAKHKDADEDGVRIAELNEMSYRELLWDHLPLTDFWRIGVGYTNRLSSIGLYTLGDVARCSIDNPKLLYDTFGINAELLIDHAWGYEPTEIKYIKEYKPVRNSLSIGQVLKEPYSFDDGRTVITEMADGLALDLVEKRLKTNQIVITVGYDVVSLSRANYKGEVVMDAYGRKIPKHAHGTYNLKRYTNSSKLILEGVLDLYDRLVGKNLYIRRLNVCVNNVIPETIDTKPVREQLSIFDNVEELDKKKEKEEKALNKEHKTQEAFIKIKNKYGKNAILKGTSFKDKATGRERNGQIGGHKA